MRARTASRVSAGVITLLLLPAAFAGCEPAKTSGEGPGGRTAGATGGAATPDSPDKAPDKRPDEAPDKRPDETPDALKLNGGKPQRGLPEITLEIRGARLGTEVASTEMSRRIGLMYRDELRDDRAMLFVYPSKNWRSFWMKNTRIPLSLAYINDAGVIVSILDMEAQAGEPDEALVHHKSSQPVRYALEVRKGWFKDNRIYPGEAVKGLFEGLAELPPAR